MGIYILVYFIALIYLVAIVKKLNYNRKLKKIDSFILLCDEEMKNFIERKAESSLINEGHAIFESLNKKNNKQKVVEFEKFLNDLPQKIHDSNRLILDEECRALIINTLSYLGNSHNFISTQNFNKLKVQFMEESMSIRKRMDGYSSINIDKIKEIDKDFYRFLNDLNLKYMNNEIHTNKKLFDNIGGYSLDMQQRMAVVNDDDRQLVIAGAGSGKTLTISAKVKYLVDVKNVKPHEILLISFTKKAANEMKERIAKLGINIDSSTFHKYGLSIIKKANQVSPEVFEDMDKILTEYINEEILNDPTKATKFLYMVWVLMIPTSESDALFKEIVEESKRIELTSIRSIVKRHGVEQNNTKIIERIKDLKQKIDQLVKDGEQQTNIDPDDDSRERRKSIIDKITDEIEELKSKMLSIKHEKMKSAEEVIIANTLFLKGIDYEYEKEFEYISDTEDPLFHKKYTPDFYLTESKLFWEHFAINKYMKTPQFSSADEKKYLEGIKWKRDIHEQNNSKLIETYSWQFQDGTIMKEIDKIIADNGIKVKDPNYIEILMILIENSKSTFKDFKSLVMTFINLFKSAGHELNHFETLKLLIKKSNDADLQKKLLKNDELYLELLDFIKGFYSYYNITLSKNNQIDFNDMIHRAAVLLNQSHFDIPYKYIIVDEYQDVSRSKVNLLKETLKLSDCKLFCVGDDWQSIYRFSGSDVDLITNFEDSYGPHSFNMIEKTYRNSQELLNITKWFVEKNESQNKKNLKSDKTLKDPIKILEYLPTNERSDIYSGQDKDEVLLENRFKEILDEIQDKDPNASVMLLTRNNSDLEFLINETKITTINKSQQANVEDEVITEHRSFKKDEKGDTYLKFKKFNHLPIKHLTVHKSKGLEADYVIVYGLRNAIGGFPNQMVDHPLLDLLKFDKENYPYSEERRLFYVALTRSKNKTYLLSPVLDSSIFVEEIAQKINSVFLSNPNKSQILHEDKKCPKCKVGFLVTRQGLGKKFYGCTSFPICDYTITEDQFKAKAGKCPLCGNFLIKRNGMYGLFYGCKSYPHCRYTTESV